MAHSEHGFSGQARIVACPGSVGRQRGIADISNEAAKLGTAVHEMGELALSFGLDTTQSFKGQKFNDIKVTQKMIDSADYYLACVYELLADMPDAVVLIETKVKMSSIDSSRLWGTADLAVIDYFNRRLVMCDYKNGYGIVELMPDQSVFATNEVIKGNAQLIGYLIALCDTLNLWCAIDTFEIMVVQPNKGHIDGECRRVQISAEQIIQWWHVFYQSHQLAVMTDAPVKAGSWCKYCRARATCKDNLQRLFNGLMMDGSIETASIEQLIELSDMSEVIKTTLGRVEERLVEEARQGLQVPNKKLVRTIVRAKCEDEDGLIRDAIASGKKREDLFHQRLKSKTDLKAMLGKQIADKYFKTPQRGYTLVDMSDTRMAVMPDRKPSLNGKFQKVNK